MRFPFVSSFPSSHVRFSLDDVLVSGDIALSQSTVFITKVAKKL